MAELIGSAKTRSYRFSVASTFSKVLRDRRKQLQFNYSFFFHYQLVESSGKRHLLVHLGPPDGDNLRLSTGQWHEGQCFSYLLVLLLRVAMPRNASSYSFCPQLEQKSPRWYPRVSLYPFAGSLLYNSIVSWNNSRSARKSRATQSFQNLTHKLTISFIFFPLIIATLEADLFYKTEKNPTGFMISLPMYNLYLAKKPFRILSDWSGSFDQDLKTETRSNIKKYN